MKRIIMFMLISVSISVQADFINGTPITAKRLNEYFSEINTILATKQLSVIFNEYQSGTSISGDAIQLNLSVLESKFPNYTAPAKPVAGTLIDNSYFANLKNHIQNYINTETFTNCQDIVNKGFSRGSGQYTIDPTGSSSFLTYCEMDLYNGGWTLFARQQATGNWNIGNPNMSRTANIGTYQADNLANDNFYRKRDDICPNYNDTRILFTTGDKSYWLVTDEVPFSYNYTNAAHQYVYASSSHPTGSSYAWYNRVGQLEDPWVSVGHHPGIILWGENNHTAHLTYKQNNNGVAVYCK